MNISKFKNVHVSGVNWQMHGKGFVLWNLRVFLSRLGGGGLTKTHFPAFSFA